MFFSGNLSFIKLFYETFDKLLKRGVSIKIPCRVNLATIANISRIQMLMQKYPGQIEVRHRYHPLRGFIIDGKIARVRVEEKIASYRKGELGKDITLAYDIYDKEWL